MRQCPAEDKTSGSSRSSHLRTSIRRFHRFAPREHHGRLSGGRRGGDVSGAASAPSLGPAACPSFGLGFGLWNPLPSLCHQEGIRQRRLQHTPTQELSHALTCAVPLGVLSAPFPSHLRQEPRCFSFEGASWRGAVFPHSFLQPQCCFQCSLRVRVIGSRQSTMRVHPSLPSTFLHGFALQYRTCDTNCTGALFQHAVLPELPSELPRVLLPTPSSRPSCAGTLPHTYTKGGPS